MPENFLRVRTVAVLAEHPEDYCHRCGGPNVSWFAPNEVWNLVMRDSRDLETRWDGIVCPVCFGELFEELFPNTSFVLTPSEQTEGAMYWAEAVIEKSIQNVVEEALREAAKKWRPYVITRGGGCPTCSGDSRETKGLVCQTCGTDYGVEPKR